MGSKEILSELWTRVVKPVLEQLFLLSSNETRSLENLLTYTLVSLQKCAGRTRPRLWWIPTGVFSFTPIHAAGKYDAGALNECCSDYVVSSYTPTIGTLIIARRGFQPIPRPNIRMILAAVSRPFKMSELSYADAEVDAVKPILEPTMIIDLFRSLDVTQGAAAGATARSVLENVSKANMLHLACHGY